MRGVRTMAVLALAVAVAVGVVGYLVLRPEAGPSPLPVDPAAYFTPAELQGAGDYRRGQRWIAGGGLIAQALALLAVAALARRRARRRKPPSAGRTGGPRLGRRRRALVGPALRGAAVGALVVVLVSAVELPFAAGARVRALDVGLATGSWGLWGIDVVRGLLIAGGAGAVCGLVAALLIRRLGPWWWVPAAVLAIGAAVAVTFARPLVLDPLANDFRPLADARLAGEIRGIAERAGVPVSGVEVIDASRRTSGVNAYVTGVGPSRKVVVYDTLLERLPRRAVRAVVAHELAHVRSDDIGRGLLFAALVLPLGLLATARVAEAIVAEPGARASGTDAPVPGLAAVVVAAALVAVPLVVTGNALSRSVEAHADAVALRLTGDSPAQVDLQVGLAISNRSDVDPPAAWQAVLGTHPTTLQRIGAALAVAGDDPEARIRRPGARGSGG